MPSIVSVQGDADDLVALQAVDTEPIRLSGETAHVTTTTRLALPPNVTVPNVDTVSVTIRIEPCTETRTFSAGFTLVGAEPGFTYDLSTYTRPRDAVRAVSTTSMRRSAARRSSRRST
jgi:YbbR domain-containing protein